MRQTCAVVEKPGEVVVGCWEGDLVESRGGVEGHQVGREEVVGDDAVCWAAHGKGQVSQRAGRGKGHRASAHVDHALEIVELTESMEGLAEVEGRGQGVEGLRGWSRFDIEREVV